MFIVGIIVAATAITTAALAYRSRGRRLALPVGLIVIVGGALGLFAVPAYAHHPIVSGDVACSTDGNTVVVTWHLQNSESVLPAGTGRIMTVNSASVDRGTLTGIAADTTVLPQPLPGSTVDGATTVAATSVGDITLTVDVRWDSPGPQSVTGAATVTLPGSCAAGGGATTTTTAAPTTTTAAPTTTTTAPGVTTTTSMSTTSTSTTIPVISTTSTSGAPTSTSTSTTAPVSTTSTSAAGLTPTTAPTKVLGAVVDAPAAGSLPRTGSPLAATSVFGLGALVLILGALGMRVRRAVDAE